MKNKIWALVLAVLFVLCAYHVVCATAKQQEMDTIAIRQWSMEYRAIHP